MFNRKTLNNVRCPYLSKSIYGKDESGRTVVHHLELNMSFDEHHRLKEILDLELLIGFAPCSVTTQNAFMYDCGFLPS